MPTSHASVTSGLVIDRCRKERIVAAVMLWSAINFSLNPEMRQAFELLGLPK
jgi:hypothetical protein